ncbi:methyl-accepting chemotaxis protein [Cytobacillus praedii]|uniref:methyl-accepting chemotaxis protein n=1 Tax=Cytobacillus praedii TaxID=1742358 RepID=UPI0007099E19|nr:HAMP domain-containing methyl-accepting chemotaxis protein [Cytobacillus praedii]
MKISTILRTIAAIIFILIIVSGFSIFSLTKNIEDQANAFNTEMELAVLGSQLLATSDYLTNQVRAYTQFGEKEYYENYWKEVNETKTTEKIIAKFQELNVPAELLHIVELATKETNSLETFEEEAIKAVENGQLEQARSFVFGHEYKAGRESIELYLDDFYLKLSSWTNSKVTDANINVKNNQMIMITSALLVVLSLLITFILLFIKIQPLTKLSQIAQKIANGDLRIEKLVIKSKDEVAILALSFNQMTDNLKGIISTVNKASENLSSSSKQLSASTVETSNATQLVSTSVEEVAYGTSIQHQQMSEILTEINNVSQGIKQIASSSSNVSHTSKEAMLKSQLGEKSINQAIAQMKTINNKVEETAQIIQLLNERSKDIEKIIVAITDISNQTNLLALNASIEAARANEHGKGFVVVADEVKKLAKESNNSARQITEIIQAIQSGTVQTVEQMNSLMENVSYGVSIIENTGRSFKEILISSQAVSTQIQEVTTISAQIASSAEQVSASYEIVNAITDNATAKTQNVASLAEEQYASMEEIAASTEELSKLAFTLNTEVSKFKL